MNARQNRDSESVIRMAVMMLWPPDRRIADSSGMRFHLM